MSAFDPQLLQALAAADAEAPPPAGTAITPASLRAAHARRRAHRLGALAAVTTIAGALVMQFACSRADDDGESRAVHAQLRALRADLDGLRESLRSLVPTPADADAAARADTAVRYELACARAAAVAAAAPPTPKDNR